MDSVHQALGHDQAMSVKPSYDVCDAEDFQYITQCLYRIYKMSWRLANSYWERLLLDFIKKILLGSESQLEKVCQASVVERLKAEPTTNKTIISTLGRRRRFDGEVSLIKMESYLGALWDVVNTFVHLHPDVRKCYQDVIDWRPV